MKNLKQDYSEVFKKLDLYVPVVDRVHGQHHPEFHDVKRIYDSMVEKLNHNESDFDSEFKTLKSLTNNYLVPGDICESYEAVYKMLEELDNAYHN